MRKLAGAVVVAAGLLAGCSSIPHLEPTLLPTPEPPGLNWQVEGGDVCLTPSDADKLDKFMDEFQAFKNARDRLRPGASGPGQGH